MLQIKEIFKKYKTGELVQTALDGVSLNFRDNEFVAILGPSGSGKTTLLNVIGGLDRYDSGDLIINGISTKQYKDRDWDSYRNHTIGFVFQSYNLIPHQTVLSNVELALTISGVSRAERRSRAKEALEQVGLGDQLHKKPNQMSGGQMQRVAIARALINNPDILLADEPTGALDSVTSVQVMELLKEVAKDRMVIMVTHNPELAEEYATRIVRLQDGRITDDTDPFTVDDSELSPPVHKNMGHSSMSLPTSVGLSLNNLLTKRGRTLLTAFAGSIGIIGIALILAVSAGVNDYIETLEEDTMSEYPIQVTSSGLDVTNMMSSVMGNGSSMLGGQGEGKDGITVMEMLSNMFSAMDSNDLESFKDYIENGDSDIDKYTKAIECIYDVEPQLYMEENDEIYQVNPETTLTSGFGLGSFLTGMMSSMVNVSSFYPMPQNENLYKDSYEIKAGRWPESYDECVLVLTQGGDVSDFMLYALGLRDYAEYEELIDEVTNGEEVPEVEYTDTYDYDEVLDTTYKMVNSSDYYEYDSEYGVWTDKQDDEEYMKRLVADGETVSIVGVVQPLEDAASAALESGINYPASLIDHVTQEAAQSEIVKEQLANPDINVLTGEEFGEDAGFDLGDIFSMDEDALSDLFNTDALADTLADSLDFSNLDLGDGLDLDSMDLSDALDLGNMDLSDMDMDLSDMDMDLSDLDLSDMDMDLSGLDMNLDGMDIDLSGMDIDFSDMGLDLSDLGMDMSDMALDMDLSDLNLDMSGLDMGSAMAGLDMSSMFDISPEKLNQLSSSLLAGYTAYAAASSGNTYMDLQNDFAAYLNTGDAQSVMNSAMERMVSDAIGRGDVRELVDQLSGSDDPSGVLTNWIVEKLSTTELTSELSQSLLSGYQSYAAANGKTTAESISAGMNDYVNSDAAVQAMSAGMMSMLNTDALQGAMESAMQGYTQEMMADVNTQLSNQLQSQMASATSGMTDQIQQQLEGQMESVMSGMADQIQQQLESQMGSSMSGMTDQIQQQLEAQMGTVMSGMTDQIQQQIEKQMGSMMSGMTDQIGEQIQDQMSSAMSGMTDQIQQQIEDALQDSMGDLSGDMADQMNIDPDSIRDAFNIDMDEDSLMELMSSMSSAAGSDYDSVLADLGYVDYNNPSEIDIYPKDFDSKEDVVDIIDGYNKKMADNGEDEKQITYTDLVGTMMSTVTTIINMVSYVLIAFVSISLIVSSIMIGIITYISVLERTREIGILRAIGASKGNISRIFNAETFIIGLCAGLLGVGIALLLLIPINMVVQHYLQMDDVRAYLPALYGLFLVVLSVVLTLIGGIIPSRKASKMDPVSALRSE